MTSDTNSDTDHVKYVDIGQGLEFQCGNFILDPEAYSMMTSSICPALTLMETNLEDDCYVSEEYGYNQASIMKDIIYQKLPASCYPSGHTGMCFLSPEVSYSDDDVSIQSLYKQMKEINQIYFMRIEANQRNEKNTTYIPLYTIKSNNNDGHEHTIIPSLESSTDQINQGIMSLKTLEEGEDEQAKSKYSIFVEDVEKTSLTSSNAVTSLYDSRFGHSTKYPYDSYSISAISV